MTAHVRECPRMSADRFHAPFSTTRAPQMQPQRAAKGGDLSRDDTPVLPQAEIAEHEISDISDLTRYSTCLIVRGTARKAGCRGPTFSRSGPLRRSEGLVRISLAILIQEGCNRTLTLLTFGHGVHKATLPPPACAACKPPRRPSWTRRRAKSSATPIREPREKTCRGGGFVGLGSFRPPSARVTGVTQRYMRDKCHGMKRHAFFTQSVT